MYFVQVLSFNLSDCIRLRFLENRIASNLEDISKHIMQIKFSLNFLRKEVGKKKETKVRLKNLESPFDRRSSTYSKEKHTVMEK